jgi:hypothetical protein
MAYDSRLVHLSQKFKNVYAIFYVKTECSELRGLPSVSTVLYTIYICILDVILVTLRLECSPLSKKWNKSRDVFSRFFRIRTVRLLLTF